MDSNPGPQDKPKPTQKQAMSLFLRAFLVPTFVTKGLIVFFGLHWVEYPDDGYGYGLAISIVLMLVNFGLFIHQCSKYHFD